MVVMVTDNRDGDPQTLSNADGDAPEHAVE